MRKLSNIFWLGTKELRSFLHDFVLLGLVIYAFSLAVISQAQSNSLSYLAAVLRGQIDPKGDLTALDTNIVVMQILDAARESARTGKSVRLTKVEE